MKKLTTIAMILGLSTLAHASGQPPAVVAQYGELKLAWTDLDALQDHVQNEISQIETAANGATNGDHGDFASHRVFMSNYLTVALTAIQNAEQEVVNSAIFKQNHPDQTALSPVPPMLSALGYDNN